MLAVRRWSGRAHACVCVYRRCSLCNLPSDSANGKICKPAAAGGERGAGGAEHLLSAGETRHMTPQLLTIAHLANASVNNVSRCLSLSSDPDPEPESWTQPSGQAHESFSALAAAPLWGPPDSLLSAPVSGGGLRSPPPRPFSPQLQARSSPRSLCSLSPSEKAEISNLNLKTAF